MNGEERAALYPTQAASHRLNATSGASLRELMERMGHSMPMGRALPARRRLLVSGTLPARGPVCNAGGSGSGLVMDADLLDW